MTLDLTTIILAVAVAMGTGAAVLSLRRGMPGPSVVAVTHGCVALAGYALMLVAISGSSRGAATGTQSFGVIAAVFLGLAVIAGLALLWQRRMRKRLSGGLIGVHATLAVTGFVILAAYVLLA